MFFSQISKVERRKAQEVLEIAKKIQPDPTSFKDDPIIRSTADIKNIAVIVHGVRSFFEPYEYKLMKTFTNFSKPNFIKANTKKKKKTITNLNKSK